MCIIQQVQRRNRRPWNTWRWCAPSLPAPSCIQATITALVFRKTTSSLSSSPSNWIYSSWQLLTSERWTGLPASSSIRMKRYCFISLFFLYFGESCWFFLCHGAGGCRADGTRCKSYSISVPFGMMLEATGKPCAPVVRGSPTHQIRWDGRGDRRMGRITYGEGMKQGWRWADWVLKGARSSAIILTPFLG